MSNETKTSGPVDVRDVIRAVTDELRASGNTGHVDSLLAADAAVAELIEQMRDVLALWDSNGMSIDGKAATMQCRPEEWRAALANVGGAK